MRIALLVTFVALGLMLLPAVVAVASLTGATAPDLKPPSAVMDAVAAARWLATPGLAFVVLGRPAARSIRSGDGSNMFDGYDAYAR